MRILHTSDWHLGQHFMGQSRQAEHSALIHWLLEQVQTHAVDAVLVAGDIFDTGAPPSYARELYGQLVVRLHDAGCALLLLGGNHDSVSVLGESRDLLACLGVSVVAALAEPASHVLTLPEKASGQPGCIVCALPFIRARDVVQSQAGQSAQDKRLALQSAIQDAYAKVYAAAVQRQAELHRSLGRKLPIIATGHLTTVGASRSESVREIYVGSLEAFPTAAFPPADYIALGHIHQPQKVGGMEHVRYSGSPIALSFDEARQTKQLLLVDVDGDGLRAVTSLQVPVFQPMAAIQATLAELPHTLAAAAQNAGPQRPVWLDIAIAADDYLADLGARVQSLAEDLPVQVLRVRRQRGNAAPRLQGQAMESLQELTPQDVFARRLALETLEPPLQQALAERYRSVVETLAAEAVDAGEGAGDSA